MENINTDSKKVVFKLKHWEGITLFKVIEQEGIERGCGEIYSGSNGWRIISRNSVSVYGEDKKLCLRGTQIIWDNDFSTKEDKDKSIYNSILETFKELGSQDTSEPNFGDRVLVRDTDDDEWSERILVHILPEEVIERFICVDCYEERGFNNGERYTTTNWKYMKPFKENSFKEISEDTFEVTF